MTAMGAFMTNWSGVPGIGPSCGAPSYATLSRAALRLTVAVWGMELAIKASWAAAVPGTEARTAPRGEAGGICANEGGSWPGATYSQGPSVERARNHRPEIRT